MSEAPPVQSLAAFAKARGLVTMADARGHIHAGLRCAAETRRLLAEADQTAHAYSAAIEAGTVAAPPRPTLEQIAEGHPDLASTLAARRVIEKRRARRNAERMDHDANALS